MLTLSKPPPSQHRPDWPPRAANRLADVDRYLRAGRAREAVDAIGLSYLQCPWTANALAVCHLRLGNVARAERLLRHIALDGDSGSLRPDAPTVFKVNLATVLLASGNAAECLRVLDAIGDDRDPSVRRAREAAVAWTGSLTAWERFARRLGVPSSRRPMLEVPLGEL